MPENSNAWISLADFLKSWRGVVTVFLAVAGSVIGTLALVGQRLSEIAAAPEDVDRLEAVDVRHDSALADAQRARDSLAVALTTALRNHSTFINLFRCEMAGYAAHECPLLADIVGLAPIPAADTVTRATIPDDGGG
jgi:hypothetical protein